MAANTGQDHSRFLRIVYKLHHISLWGLKHSHCNRHSLSHLDLDILARQHYSNIGPQIEHNASSKVIRKA